MIEIKSDLRNIARGSRSNRVSGILQRLLISVGVILLALFAFAKITGDITTHAAILNFETSKASVAGGDGADDGIGSNQGVDYSLWSALRIRLYKESLKRYSEPPLGLLKIPKLHIVAPVLEGTGSLALNIGVGRIQGTAHPGERGNVGLAGHRDGFFRGLKDITKGDTIELVTKARTDVYVVDAVNIVSPADVKVLGAGATPSVTLVTCYPFYFAGSAPKRYIVHASLREQ
jgi:sortase A